MKIRFLLFALFIVTFVFQSNAQYFPPINGTNWESISPESLSWNISKIEELYEYLDNKNTKAFIVLKDGKIVIEKYFDSFARDSIWYWASAGKTLTAALVGIAQEEGLLSINDRTSKYLGNGWTSCTMEKEDLITIRHQLTMTTGLDYNIEDLDCTNPECLKYKSDAGSQWYYHNAPYTLLENVVEKSSGKNYNQFFFQKIRNKIGMNGIWYKTDFNNVYYSNARSMARFGLLMLNNGNWDGNEVIKDKNYIQEMINTSQELNKSYGYLWWLNGKESSMIPGLAIVLERMLSPDAPHDLYSALGKNGQILSISPSKGIIVVRMGERPDEQLFISTDLCNQIWQYLNGIMAITNVEKSMFENFGFNISPNPASDYIEIKIGSIGDGYNENNIWASPNASSFKIYNTFGELVMTEPINPLTPSYRINIEQLPLGLYFIQIGNYSEKFVVVR